MANVLILGATSAIAEKVALLHAGRGDTLYLVGRNGDKLSALASRVGGCASSVADFTDTDRSVGCVETAIETLGGLDTALVAHGDLGDQLASEASFEAAEHTIHLNFVTVVSLLVPLANHFEKRKAGRLGVITSVAGDRGRPRNYTYGAAKGALHIYLQGLRSRLYPDVSVTTLKVGPTDTPMTHSHKKSPLFGRTDDVAKGIVRAMDGRRAEAYIPGFWAAIMPIVKHTPEALFQLFPFLSGR